MSSQFTVEHEKFPAYVLCDKEECDFCEQASKVTPEALQALRDKAASHIQGEKHPVTVYISSQIHMSPAGDVPARSHSEKESWARCGRL